VSVARTARAFSGDYNCIGQISAKRQEDIDKFVHTAGQSARYPIYTAQQVVVDDSSQALRRFAISTDADLSELPLPNQLPLPHPACRSRAGTSPLHANQALDERRH
jgi:hypothetical protein